MYVSDLVSSGFILWESHPALVVGQCLQGSVVFFSALTGDRSSQQEVGIIIILDEETRGTEPFRNLPKIDLLVFET